MTEEIRFAGLILCLLAGAGCIWYIVRTLRDFLKTDPEDWK